MEFTITLPIPQQATIYIKYKISGVLCMHGFALVIDITNVVRSYNHNDEAI